MNRIIATLLTIFLSVVAQAQTVPEGKLFAYDVGCLATNYVLPEDFGTLTPGAAADSTQRAANTTAINAAIAAAPAGGSVCLPADSLYLTLDVTPTSYSSQGILRVGRDSISIWGAGACGWGNMAGCSYLATPGDSLYYRGPVNDDGKDHLVRGHGIVVTARPAPNDSLRNITLKGFELDGQSGWTGCYSYNYDWLYSVHFNCWDMGHKGVIIGSDRNVTDVLIEDVKVHHYKGEVIYQGGFGTGTVTVRRAWSFESNGSAHNFATAKNMLVEDSKFGPNVRFWGEYLAEGIDEAKALFRRNEYVGCEYSSGCIAMAVQSSGTTISQDWTWENNTFQLKGPNYHAFYISPGRPYTLRLLNNTFDGGRLFITGGNQAALTVLDIQGNTITSTGNKLWIWQGGRWGGAIRNNTFTGSGQLFEGGCNCDQLVVENNTFIGLTPPVAAPKLTDPPGNGIAALFRNNTYTTDPPVVQFFNGDGRRISPQSEKLRLMTNFQAYVAEFGPESANGQVTQVVNAKSSSSVPYNITLPGGADNHSWTEDIILAPYDTMTVRFDRTLMKWFIEDGEPQEPSPSVLTGGTLGSGTGSFTAPTTGRYQITGRGQGIYRTQREGYALRKPIADGDSFSVQIDSLTTWEGPYERLQGGGIVISDSTSATSPGLYILYRPLSQWLVVWHAQTENTVPVFAGLARIKAPFTVKVKRTGTAYTVSYSSDGETFTQLAEVDLTLTRPFVGVFSSSNSANVDTILHVSGVSQ